MKNLRLRILCGIFGFYLMLAFLIPQAGVLIYGVLLDKSELTDCIATAENAAAAREAILEKCEEIADPCELPMSVYNGIFPEDKLLEDIRTGIEKALNFEEYTADTAEQEALLAENVRAALREQLETDDVSELEADVTDFCEQSADCYNKYVYLTAYYHFRSLSRKISRVGLVAWAVFAVLLAIGLFFLIRLLRRGGSVLREVSYSVLAAGVCNALLAWYVIRIDLFGNIQMEPHYFRDAMISFLDRIVSADLTVGLATAGLGLALFALSVWIDLRARKKQNSEENRVA